MKRQHESTYHSLADDEKGIVTLESNKEPKLELKACAELFDPISKPPIFVGSKAIHRKYINGSYKIYSKNTFQELLHQGKHKLRFLLSTDFKLLFAEEGVPNSSIPIIAE